MRQFAATLLSCALLSAILLAGPLPAAHAQDYEIVEDAQSYIGTPYGAYGFDCSGFTSTVFADFGAWWIIGLGLLTVAEAYLLARLWRSA